MALGGGLWQVRGEVAEAVQRPFLSDDAGAQDAESPGRLQH